MQIDGGFKPTEQDFEGLSVQIVKLCRDSKKPPTIQEISNFINRPLPVTEIYCDRLSEAGEIHYVPTGKGVWGYFAHLER
jgi:hypothetical protein